MKKLIYKICFLLLAFLSFSCKNANNKEYREIAQVSQENESIVRGKKIYNGLCSRCHLPDGTGIPEETPPLAGSNWLTEKRTETIHALKFGLKGKIEVNGMPYRGFMPKSNLEPQQTADVINYIMNSWGNTSEKLVTIEDVVK